MASPESCSPMISCRLMGPALIFFLFGTIIQPLHAQLRFPNEETGLEWLFITGPEAPDTMGDDDHIQVFYLSLPAAYEDSFRIRIHDPGCLQPPDQQIGVYDSRFAVRVFGGDNLYFPVDFGIREGGNLLYYQTFGDLAQELISPYIPLHKGALFTRENLFLFRLEIEGISGNDGNAYALSIEMKPDNDKIRQARLLTRNLSFLLPDDPNLHSEIKIPVPALAEGISIRNFDWDEDGQIRVVSSVRKGQFVFTGKDAETKTALLKVFEAEKGDSLKVQFLKKKSSVVENNAVGLSWLIEDKDGADLSLDIPFTIPDEISKKRRLK